MEGHHDPKKHIIKKSTFHAGTVLNQYCFLFYMIYDD